MSLKKLEEGLCSQAKHIYVCVSVCSCVYAYVYICIHLLIHSRLLLSISLMTSSDLGIDEREVLMKSEHVKRVEDIHFNLYGHPAVSTCNGPKHGYDNQINAQGPKANGALKYRITRWEKNTS